MFVHSFESMAARDGDGIRYGVFLSGCPLRCVYCHNPDTQKQSGKYYTPEEIAKKALRYKPYFKNNGGVTFSGGEPLLQSMEIVKMGRILKTYGIGYILDTSLAVPESDFVRLAIDGADMVLADLKFANSRQMLDYTGGNLDYVLTLLSYVKKTGKRFRIRTVVVPNINDTISQIEEYVPIIQEFSPECWELLPFHTMGFFKYEEAGIENPLTNTKPLDIDTLESLKKQIKSKYKNLTII